MVIDGHSDILLPVVTGTTSLTGVSESEMERWAVVAAHQQPANRTSDVPHDLDPLALAIAPAGQYELPLLEEGGVTAECVALFLPENMLDHALETALEMVAALTGPSRNTLTAACWRSRLPTSAARRTRARSPTS